MTWYTSDRLTVGQNLFQMDTYSSYLRAFMGHCKRLVNGICISQHGDSAVNSEKTIFMKRKGDEYIIHGLFVDDMMHIYSCDAMKDEFHALYKKDFDITGGTKMEIFLGMVVEQSGKSIKIHLDNYVKDVVAEYAQYIKEALRPKKVQISPGVAFETEDAPELPDPLKQKYCRSFVAKLQFAATWILFDILFAVSQLARYCASAGTAQWAALHHLMEYLSIHLSFKITCRRGVKLVDLISGYVDADWGYISSSMSTSGMVMLYNK